MSHTRVSYTVSRVHVCSYTLASWRLLYPSTVHFGRIPGGWNSCLYFIKWEKKFWEGKMGKENSRCFQAVLGKNTYRSWRPGSHSFPVGLSVSCPLERLTQENAHYNFKTTVLDCLAFKNKNEIGEKQRIIFRLNSMW